MRTTIFATFAFSILFLLSAKSAIAQSGLPAGDYKQTCQNMRSDGARVYATCQKRNGGWRKTSLNYRGCRGPVINDDGNLRCGQGGSGYGYSNGAYGGWQGQLPPGDYKRTCQNMRVNGDRLDATCQSRGGGWHDTSLNNVYACRTGIVNDDGNLRCER